MQLVLPSMDFGLHGVVGMVALDLVVVEKKNVLEYALDLKMVVWIVLEIMKRKDCVVYNIVIAVSVILDNWDDHWRQSGIKSTSATSGFEGDFLGHPIYVLTYVLTFGAGQKNNQCHGPVALVRMAPLEMIIFIYNIVSFSISLYYWMDRLVFMFPFLWIRRISNQS